MSETIGADVTPEFKEQIDGAREENESRSACVRRLIRRGLEAEAKDELERAMRRPRTSLQVLGILGGIVYVLTHFTAPDFLGAVGGAYIVGTLVWANWHEWTAWAARVRREVVGPAQDDAESEDESEVGA